jgi:tight adherence protein C
MGIALVIFAAVFLLIVSGGLLVFYRQTMMQRIQEAINPRPKQKTLRSAIQETGLSIGGVVERFENVLPKSQAEVSVTVQRLTRAGFRGDSAMKIFYGSKVLTPILLCVVVLVTGLGNSNPMLWLVGAGLGFLIPDFWLGRKIAARQKKVERGLPDVLDILVICVEAGLGLDQATARTVAEMDKGYPELCDELKIVVLEQRAGRARSEAWKHLADRTGLDALRNLVSMMVQSDQFGTSIAKTLRIQADTLRSQRVQAVEEKAAKTSVKLVFPLVLLIFPALFLVILGPAVILMMESFATLQH